MTAEIDHQSGDFEDWRYESMPPLQLLKALTYVQLTIDSVVINICQRLSIGL